MEVHRVRWTARASRPTVYIRSLPDKRSLRSTGTDRLWCHRSNDQPSVFGNRAFPVAGPKTWNALPQNVAFQEVISGHHCLILTAY